MKTPNCPECGSKMKKSNLCYMTAFNCTKCSTWFSLKNKQQIELSLKDKDENYDSVKNEPVWLLRVT